VAGRDCDGKTGKTSIVGVGIKSHAGVVGKHFEPLAKGEAAMKAVQAASIS
jgi:aspartokinase